MQVTLCAILAATLGLAMLVSHRKLGVRLTASRNAGGVEAQLPFGWFLEEENKPPIMYLLRESPATRGGRTMTIRLERVSPGVSTLQYLKEGTLLRGTLEILGADDISPVTIAGVPGLLVHRRRPMAVQVDDEMEAAYQSVWFAAGVLPSGQAISIELACPVELDPEADKAIIANTAAGIAVGRGGSAENPNDQGPKPQSNPKSQ